MIKWLQSGIFFPITCNVPAVKKRVCASGRVVRRRERRVFDKFVRVSAVCLKEDPLGGASGERNFQDVCLPQAFQALGVPVEINRSGPFRADLHGNPMLSPWGKKLVKVTHGVISQGKYILWCAGHFSAVIVADRVTVIEKNRTMQ
jgi:hypothetical protein